MNRLIRAFKSDRQIQKDLTGRGFMYIGDIDHTDDDVTPIRGYTHSIKHRDSHFAVGSYQGFDVRFVRRSEGQRTSYVAAFSVKSAAPRFFIQNRDTQHPIHADRHVQSMILDHHSNTFTHNYEIIAKPQDFVLLESIWGTHATRALSTHLWPFSVEYADGTLYIYCHDVYSSEIFASMLRTGAWIAKHIST